MTQGLKPEEIKKVEMYEVKDAYNVCALTYECLMSAIIEKEWDNASKHLDELKEKLQHLRGDLKEKVKTKLKRNAKSPLDEVKYLW